MNLQQWAQQVESLSRQVPTRSSSVSRNLGSLLLGFFLRNFDAQGYEPQKSVVPWAERKVGLDHQALNKTGYLRSCFRVAEATPGRVEVVNDAPYAQYLNDGTATMPARPLLYESEELNAQVAALLTREFGDLFQF